MKPFFNDLVYGETVKFDSHDNYETTWVFTVFFAHCGVAQRVHVNRNNTYNTIVIPLENNDEAVL